MSSEQPAEPRRPHSREPEAGFGAEHAAGAARPERPAGAAHPARTGRPARPRPKRSLQDRLLSENLRMALSLLFAFVIAGGAMLLFPGTNFTLLRDSDQKLAAVQLTFAVFTALYFLGFSLLTLAALREQPRARLLAVARLSHARKTVPAYRWLAGRSGAVGEVGQLMITAGISIYLLASRPPNLPLVLLLAVATTSIVITWISSVVTFTLEYAAADSDGTAFTLEGTPAPERELPEYLYAAILVQTSAGPTELIPLTRDARRLVRNQAVLSHVMSTIIVAVGVSVLLTAVG